MMLRTFTLSLAQNSDGQWGGIVSVSHVVDQDETIVVDQQIQYTPTSPCCCWRHAAIQMADEGTMDLREWLL